MLQYSSNKKRKTLISLLLYTSNNLAVLSKNTWWATIRLLQEDNVNP